MIGEYSLSEVAKECKGIVIGNDVKICRFSTDSRDMLEGDAFIALKGKNFDGNDLVAEAAKKGAVAAVVTRKIDTNLPMLHVDDGLNALAAVARITRERSSAQIIGITGSQGKTTVKEMTGSILSQAGSTLITPKNQNNTIGVPLTLLSLTDQHEFAVIEMGADRHGEIKFSASSAKPNIALITNAKEAHVEGFGSLTGIVEAKGEIIDATDPMGRLVLNHDDNNVETWVTRAKSRVVKKFSGQNPSADYFASDVSIGSKGTAEFILNTPVGSQPIKLGLLGNHNVLNAVASSAVAMEAGASLMHVKTGLESVKPVCGRLSLARGIKQCKVLDDTYNASPSSFKAAIDVLKLFPGEKVLVAGDMRELGTKSEEFHGKIGEYAANAGIERLYAIGEKSRHMVRAFGSGAKHFSSRTQLIDECREIASPNLVFLVKGSRGSRMEAVMKKLRKAEED